ncbi:hypothetical protein QC763_0004430 [Podospora pseudopauciseta]|uniref:Uncharacterized protein n=2 Tax=Podospora TaxID=5144 RepID=A0ABR0HWZ2_9PEZI|nr:hypothetical protein QC763_0004430 [Podospora pseudopauciseta]KAK4680991.1 hypothetical protein QC764_0004440 [Podospora pseudoanserina]
MQNPAAFGSPSEVHHLNIANSWFPSGLDQFQVDAHVQLGQTFPTSLPSVGFTHGLSGDLS